ncbi:MAG TPA: class I SAM-dependent methyltransferase [Vicinamibacterales bacterium]|nr:class I SAM-dependent methyltransferase [Vicinamibacterales bacterium]
MEHLLSATARAEARHFWFRGLRAFVTPLVQTALARPAARVAILDCGCGTGANVEWLSCYGCACGFDLSATGLRIGREAGRSRLARATVAAAPFLSEKFDLVTSFDVLYSLEDEVEASAIAEMYRVLKPGGHAIVNVAALNVLRGDHSVLSHEVRRYSRRGLGVRLEAAGFSIVRLTYTNATLVPPLLAARFVQRWRGLRPENEAETEIRVPPEPVNALMSLVMRLEAAWIRRFDAPFGSSLLCLAQKPAGTGDW